MTNPGPAPYAAGDVVVWKLAPKGAAAGKVATCEWKQGRNFWGSEDIGWQWWCRVEWHGLLEHVRADDLRRPDVIEALGGLA